MEETINPTPEYLKGYNEGYLMERDIPHLSSKLAALKSETERTKGFQDGRRQYVLEKANELRKSKSISAPTKQEKSKGRSRDRDIEKE